MRCSGGARRYRSGASRAARCSSRFGCEAVWIQDPVSRGDMPQLVASAGTRRRQLRAEAARLRLETEAEALEEVQTQETQRREKPRNKTEADSGQLLRAFAIALACALLLEGAFHLLVSLVRGSGARGGASAFDALRQSHEDVARAAAAAAVHGDWRAQLGRQLGARDAARQRAGGRARAGGRGRRRGARAHAPARAGHGRAPPRAPLERHGEGDERYRLDQHGLGDGASAHSTHVYSYRAHHATPRRSDHAARWRPHGFVDVALGRSAASVAENFHAANETLFVLVVKDPFAWRVVEAIRSRVRAPFSPLSRRARARAGSSRCGCGRPAARRRRARGDGAANPTCTGS